MEVFLDALKDSALMLPFLFVVYVVIEFIEKHYIFGQKVKGILRGKFAPLCGAGLGLIPQCGFSVMATNLYLTKNITLGTLVAIFIATSDEAIPILISNFDKAGALLPILGIKVLFAIIAGYLTDLITYKYQTNQYRNFIEQKNLEQDEKVLSETIAIAENEEEQEKGCCGHIIGAKQKILDNKKDLLKNYLLHPMVHTLKIFAFIFIINLIFGYIVFFVGEGRIADFMMRIGWFQPFLTGLVGLIPNCSSSVIITQMYVLGGISTGACITGLSINSGVAVAVLLQKSKQKGKVLLLIGALYLASVIVGILVTALGI